VLGAGAGFPRGQRLIGDETVSEDPGIEIQGAADAEIDTVLIASMRPVSHHEAAAYGIDDPGPRRHGEKWSPAPSLLIPTIDPEMHFRHRTHQVVALLVNADDAVCHGDGFHSPRAQVMRPAQSKTESHVLK